MIIHKVVCGCITVYGYVKAQHTNHLTVTAQTLILALFQHEISQCHPEVIYKLS